jgi:hypothetical protein
MGYFWDTLIMNSNDPEVPTKKVITYSEGLKAVLSVNMYAFSMALDSGEIGTANVPITNTGNRPLVITDIIVPPLFSVELPTFPYSIAPKATAPISFHTNGDVVGSRQGVVRIKGELTSKILFDTAFTISAIVHPLAGVHLEDDQSRLVIRPNPASTTITIDSYSKNTTKASINILDLSGKRLLQFHTDRFPTSCSIATLPSGKYFIEITSGGEVIRRSFIKQ